MIGKLLGNPYVLVGLAAACFVAGATVNGWRLNSAHKNALAAAIEAQSQAYKERDAFHAKRQAADEAAGVSAAELRAALEDTRNDITAAIAGQTFTEREAPTDEKPCPDTRRSPAYRLCVNAAISGDAAATAACKASRGNDGLQGEPVPTS